MLSTLLGRKKGVGWEPSLCSRDLTHNSNPDVGGQGLLLLILQEEQACLRLGVRVRSEKAGIGLEG